MRPYGQAEIHARQLIHFSFTILTINSYY
jgi:hypothetical protein